MTEAEVQLAKRPFVTIPPAVNVVQGGHGTGKTGNLVLTFSRQEKHRDFCCDTGKKF